MGDLSAHPFVPGRVRGVLRRGGDAAGAADTLLIATADEVAQTAVKCAGLVLVGGPPMSHSVIRLVGLGIPAVRVVPEQARRLKEGETALIDGSRGLLFTGEQAENQPLGERPAAPPSGKAVRTADGESVQMRASVADAAGASLALSLGASGIGLLRSEMMAPPDPSTPPDQAFYEKAFSEVCEAAHPLPVTLRLIDIAGDKYPAWMPPLKGASKALGFQGSRLYAMEPVRSVLRAQVAAAGQVAPTRDLRLLVPYLSRTEVFVRLRGDIEAWLPAPAALGAMLETPAAALDIAQWLVLADFVAIGCNDLLQCLFGASRDDETTGALIDPYAPVIFRFLKLVADYAGGGAGQIQLCGLLPQVSGVLPLLLGLGYRSFSVEPVLIPHLAQTVSGTDTDEAAHLALAACATETADAVRRILGRRESALWGLG